jgi:hypothetical protein
MRNVFKMKCSGSLKPGQSVRDQGFSLVSVMVAMSVMSILGLALMNLLGSQYRASAAMNLDMDRLTVWRGFVNRTDCERSKAAALPPTGTAPIALFSKSGGVVLPAKIEGERLGRFTYRAVVDNKGDVFIESRGSAEGRSLRDPAGNFDLSNWKSLTSAPICSAGGGTPNPQGTADARNRAPVDPDEDTSARLVLFANSVLKALDGDIAVTAEYILDGGYSCRNQLVFTCDGKEMSLSREDQTVSFTLRQDRGCYVEVRSRTAEGASGNCQSGPIAGARGKNAATAMQGFNLYRIQWEDRLANRDDAEKCFAQKRAGVPLLKQFACQRTEAMDWNDGIWSIRGQAIRPVVR